MSSIANRRLNTNKVFYGITIASVLMFVIGMVVTLLYQPSDSDSAGLLSSNYFDFLTLFVPFSLWAWLIIFGILFVKKNWLVISICIVLAIPHIIIIAVLIGYSYSFLEILKWYVMILSFGGIVLAI